VYAASRLSSGDCVGLVRELAGGVLSCAAVLGGLCSLVRELAGGVLSCAAVLRGGLGPPTPPLCRYAEYTACQLLHTWSPIHRCYPNQLFTQPWRLVCTAQRHKGGARRAEDSRGAVHAKCQGVHRVDFEEHARSILRPVFRVF
jgi:hypothetical protein